MIKIILIVIYIIGMISANIIYVGDFETKTKNKYTLEQYLLYYGQYFYC